MPAPSEKTIGERLRSARALEGLSQSQAAEKWGINRRTLQSWEAVHKIHEPRGLARKALEDILKKIERKHGRVD